VVKGWNNKIVLNQNVEQQNQEDVIHQDIR